MLLTPGTRLGPYEILSAIGAGGMGEVYRARDVRLKRDVALKILPESFAADPDRLARFQREAEVLASLNHPHIATIHGFEDSGATRALVLELVEGDTLADRIALGPIPLNEALAIAQQICEALEAAHEQGIIHRDLKPANVKITPNGMAKVLDFGLAKLAHSGAAAPADLTASPTITSPAMVTGVGVLLGTAAYMSPEQAKGREADKRSDVWAFGAVLYEMLTGRRPFEGEDLSDTLAAVLKSEPDWNALPADVPPHIRVLIQRCLAKDRRQRMADMSVVLFVMTEAASLPPAVHVAAGEMRPPARPPPWRRLVIPVAVAVAVGATVGAAVWLAMRPGAVHVTRFALSPTGASALFVDPVNRRRDLAITTDGTHIVFNGAGIPDTQLFVRALDQVELTLLAGLGRPRDLFSSPDGQWIGFVDTNPAQGVLKKVAIAGGAPLPICRLEGESRGATWGDDDSIIFAASSPSTGLQHVSSAGGEPTVLTTPDRQRGEEDHLWPQFLPGSQAVLFTITAQTGGIDASQVVVLDLRTRAQKVLVRGGSQAQYVPSGHLVYAVAGTLRAVGFDLGRLETIGPPALVLPQVATWPIGTARFDISRDGTLVYVSGASMVTAQTLVWVDRLGHEEPVKAGPRAYTYPRLSPDGTRVALDIRDQENDIWVWDFARETLTRVTSDPGLDRAPAWMPDGRLVYSGNSGGPSSPSALLRRTADGTGTAERLTSDTVNVGFPSSVSSDGTRVVMTVGAGLVDVVMRTLGKDRVDPLVQTPAAERNGEISPDGRWLAYESNSSGQYQIYVSPFPDVDKGRSQVSTGGGQQPLWARNGQELFYLAPNGALMSVPVERGTTWTAGRPIRLIDAQNYVGVGTNGARTYDVAPDGKRFLMIKQSGGSDETLMPPSIVVVQNWFEELKRR